MRKRKKKDNTSPPRNTAVIYARFSSSKQREASIEDQVRICGQWCESNGYAVVNTYCDRAASGRTDDRPQFQQMVSNAGESEVVVVYMMDRFSRDVYDAPIYKKRLRDRGVRVVSATESMPDGPEAMLMESIYEAMAAMESAHTSIRTRRGMDGNALKCMHNGVALYGYDLGDDGYYHVNAAKAPNVREAFALRSEGKSFGWIARTLAANGVTTMKGLPCTSQMVQAMIRNEKYKGVYRWGDVRVERGMPSIVTEEEWDMAQAIRSAKRRAEEDWTDFAFSGKGVCGRCGMNLVGVSGRGRNNVKYTYYRCSDRCGAKTVRADVLEGAVADALRRLVSEPDRVAEIADAVRSVMEGESNDAKAAALESERSELQRKVDNLTAAIEGGMPYKVAQTRMEGMLARIDVIDRELRVMTAKETGFDIDTFVEFLTSDHGISDRTLLDVFAWQVQLFDDRAIVVLSYDVKGEPARIEVPVGSHEIVWLPRRPTGRNERVVLSPTYVRGSLSIFVVEKFVMMAVDFS